MNNDVVVRHRGAATKTAGQIAYEAWYDRAAPQADWKDGDAESVRWEAVGSALVEACALRVESMHLGKDVNDNCIEDGDEIYNRALRDGAGAIRDQRWARPVATIFSRFKFWR